MEPSISEKRRMNTLCISLGLLFAAATNGAGENAVEWGLFWVFAAVLFSHWCKQALIKAKKSRSQ